MCCYLHRVDAFCEDNNILNENQGGFRKNHSTISTVAIFTNNLFNAINSKHISIATYIDFSKAFDTVNPQYNFFFLNVGKNGNVKKLLGIYLEMREQKTIGNNVESNTASITCGVPQGFVLEHLLFLLYINDL